MVSRPALAICCIVTSSQPPGGGMVNRGPRSQSRIEIVGENQSEGSKMGSVRTSILSSGPESHNRNTSAGASVLGPGGARTLKRSASEGDDPSNRIHVGPSSSESEAVSTHDVTDRNSRGAALTDLHPRARYDHNITFIVRNTDDVKVALLLGAPPSGD